MQVHANPALNHYSLAVYYPQIVKLSLMRKQDNLKRVFDRFLINTERVWLSEQGSVDFMFELQYKKNFAVYHQMYANSNIPALGDWYTAVQIQFPELTRNDDLFEWVCLGLVRRAIERVYTSAYRDGGGTIGELLDEIEPKLISLSFNQFEDPVWPGKWRLLPYLSLKIPKNRQAMTNRQRSIWIHALDTLMEVFVNRNEMYAEISKILHMKTIEGRRQLERETVGIFYMWSNLLFNSNYKRNVFWYDKDDTSGENFQVAWTGQ